MALKFVINGVSVEADNAAEAAELIRALGKQSAAQSAPLDSPRAPRIQIRRRQRIQLRSKIKKNGFDVRSVAIAFMTKIQEAGRNGIAAEGLMEVMGARHPKGIGAKSAAVNEYLVKMGFDPESVYDNPRTAEGRFWTAKPK